MKKQNRFHYTDEGGKPSMGELFDKLVGIKQGEAYARAKDPGTSHTAAESVRGKEANRLEGIVLDALKEHPEGLTTHDLVPLTGIDRVTVSPRMKPLCDKGLIYDSGERRIGSKNKPCIVWKAK